MTRLNKHRVAISPLTGNIYLARFGKDPHTALDKRDAEREVIAAVTEWLTLKGGVHEYKFGTTSYRLTIQEQKG